jgi:uncharacterized RDD family membrane protein YckC
MAYTFKHGKRPLKEFTIPRAVGSGGFGEVYYAISVGGREVALKYLRDNPEVELRGVGHCINLKSPHLVTIFDVKKNAEGEYFIVMEYCSGPSLRDLLIAEPNGFGPQKAAFFVREIAKGLAYLHDRGIVHRDLKPGNIFYDDGYVKIGDYGLSKFISVSRHSVQTSSVGTVHYMAPEIGSGNYSRSVDIYALGVMLFEMLLGKVPFEGSTMAEVLMKHLTSQPEVDELPAPFAKVIRTALEKDPKDRYQTAHALAELLPAVDAIEQSLSGLDPASLKGAAREPAGNPAISPQPSQGQPLTQPRVVEEAHLGRPAMRMKEAIRDLADATGDALKAAAAGTPPGHPAPLTAEARAGKLQYAGFWIRFLAVFIDWVIVGLAAAPFGENPAAAFLMIVYQGILIGVWNGQTVGKRACGIKVISVDGRACGVGQAFGRVLAKLLNVFTLFIGYLMIPFDWQKRGLHDRIANTFCVHAVQ